MTMNAVEMTVPLQRTTRKDTQSQEDNVVVNNIALMVGNRRRKSMEPLGLDPKR